MKRGETLTIMIFFVFMLVTGTSTNEGDSNGIDKKMREEFEVILAGLEDREAAQLCIGISGKSDIQDMAARFKKVPEWNQLPQEEQAKVYNSNSSYSHECSSIL